MIRTQIIDAFILCFLTTVLMAGGMLLVSPPSVHRTGSIHSLSVKQISNQDGKPYELLDASVQLASHYRVFSLETMHCQGRKSRCSAAECFWATGRI